MEWEFNFGTLLWWICLIWFINVAYEILKGPCSCLKECCIFTKKIVVFILNIIYKLACLPFYVISRPIPTKKG